MAGIFARLWSAGRVGGDCDLWDRGQIHREIFCLCCRQQNFKCDSVHAPTLEMHLSIYIYKFIKKTQCFCWSGWWLKNLVHEFPTRLISLRTKMNNIHRIIHKSSFRRAWTYASSPTNGVSAMPLLKFPCGKNAKRSDRMWPRFDGCHSALERTLQYEGTAIAKPPAKQVMLMRCCTYLPTTLLLYGRHHEWNIS